MGRGLNWKRYMGPSTIPHSLSRPNAASLNRRCKRDPHPPSVAGVPKPPQGALVCHHLHNAIVSSANECGHIHQQKSSGMSITMSGACASDQILMASSGRVRRIVDEGANGGKPTRSGGFVFKRRHRHYAFRTTATGAMLEQDRWHISDESGPRKQMTLSEA